MGLSGKIVRIKVAVELVEQIFKTGYEARGHKIVADGLPPEARLEQAQLNTEPSGLSFLYLYFCCDGDGFEDRTPTLVRKDPT